MTAQPAAPADAPICGVTRSTGRIEWVCIRPVHDTATGKNRGQQVTGYHPQSERHYMVPKYAVRGPVS